MDEEELESGGMPEEKEDEIPDSGGGSLDTDAPDSDGTLEGEGGTESSDEEGGREIVPIELFVEDGTCVRNANSYASVEFADRYNNERGRSEWLDLDEEFKKRCLVCGTDYIDRLYKWYGRRKFREQELAFPRVNIVDSDGFPVVGIPKNLQKAVCEAAYLNKGVETLFKTRSEEGAVKREKVDALEMEYFEGGSSTVDYTSIYEVLNTLLYGLYRTEADASTCNVGSVWSDDELL